MPTGHMMVCSHLWQTLFIKLKMGSTEAFILCGEDEKKVWREVFDHELMLEQKKQVIYCDILNILKNTFLVTLCELQDLVANAVSWINTS
jgi:hypothetical protein